MELVQDPVRFAQERPMLHAGKLDQPRARDRTRDEPSLVDGVHPVVDPIHDEGRHVDGPKDGTGIDLELHRVDRLDGCGARARCQ